MMNEFIKPLFSMSAFQKSLMFKRKGECDLDYITMKLLDLSKNKDALFLIVGGYIFLLLVAGLALHPSKYCYVIKDYTQPIYFQPFL